MKKRILSIVTALLLALTLACWPSERHAKVYAANDGYSRQVAALTNQERAKKGLALLKYSDELSCIANARAEEITSRFSHTRPDGSDCSTIMDDFGIRYSYFGENIACGPTSPEMVVAAWMDSPSHRANILSGFRYIGVGVAVSNGNYYWVQLFASSGSLSGTVVTVEGAAEVTGTTATSKTSAVTRESTADTTVGTTAATASSAVAATRPSTAGETGQTASATTAQSAPAEASPSDRPSIWARIAAFFKRIFGLL